MVHNGEFAPLFLLMMPTGRDCIPNGVLQQPALARVYRAGWSFTVTDVGYHVLHVASMIWQYPCEDLIVTGPLYQVVERFQKGHIPRKMSSRRSKRRSLLKSRPPERHRLSRNAPGPYIGEFLIDDSCTSTPRTPRRLQSLRDTPDLPE